MAGRGLEKERTLGTGNGLKHLVNLPRFCLSELRIGGEVASSGKL